MSINITLIWEGESFQHSSKTKEFFEKEERLEDGIKIKLIERLMNGEEIERASVTKYARRIA